MKTFMKIAWRNITRNRRRSFITIGAVGFGLGALIFILAFVYGAHGQMVENYTSLMTGHIQIHRQGFHQQKKLELNIAQPDALLNRLKEISSVQAAALRIKAVGLISSAESSAGVMVLGVFPEEEKNVNTIHKRLRTGTFLDKDNPDDIILGAGLAKNLNVTVGDKVVIMSQALDGSIAAGAYHIKGIFDTGTDEVDQGLALINHAAAQELFVMPEATSEIVLRLHPSLDAQIVAGQIQKNLSQPDLEVLSWQKIAPSFQQWIEFDNAFIWIIVGVVMIVVAIGILNTVLMGVLERTREFGILLALGTKPKEIVAIVGWESFFLGTIGSVMGTALGVGLTGFFSKAGINLTIFTKALNSFYIDAVVYPQLNVPDMTISLILVLTTSLVVSIYPAWHAAHLKPMEAIRSL